MTAEPERSPALALPRAHQVILRLAGSLLLLGAVAALSRDHLLALDLVKITAAIQQMHPLAWAGALLATGVSFAAIGAYDVVVHRHLATGLPVAQARRSGMAAIAIGQVLGLGLLTGTILRWRMLPGPDLRQAATVTGHVTALFLVGWAVVTALVLALVPAAPFRAEATVALAVLLPGLGLAALWPGSGRFWLRPPNLLTWGRLIPLAAVDLVAAAAALWFLGPDGIGFGPLLAAFLLALGAGLIASTPGGIGVFELTLIALLPGIDREAMLAAVLAWRVVYHALPSAIAAAAALLLPGGPRRATGRDDGLERLATSCGTAEIGLRHQGEHRLQRLGPQTACLAGRTAHHLICLFDPFGPLPCGKEVLSALGAQARAESRLPAVYKVGGGFAAQARRADGRSSGWRARR